ncbi:hypothetical protein [Pseudocitrobacter corydidari]
MDEGVMEQNDAGWRLRLTQPTTISPSHRPGKQSATGHFRHPVGPVSEAPPGIFTTP